ncbi:MAG TPA: hypothetical protein VN324_00375, partial [Quisquiliibacterium sp.]|nr:hypothetical protein [Quisquiliibacterium sp.]
MRAVRLAAALAAALALAGCALSGVPGASGAGRSQPGAFAEQARRYSALSVTVRPERLGERAWFV